MFTTGPKHYFAKAMVEVSVDPIKFWHGPIAESKREAFRFVTDARQLIAAQMEVLQQTNILDPVIQRHELTTRFSRTGKLLTMEEARVEFRKGLVVQSIPNTNYLEIGFYDSDPQRAADIANSIATVYQRIWYDKILAAADRSMEQLSDELKSQRLRTEEAAAEAARIRTESGIIDPQPESDRAKIMVPEEKRAELKSYMEAKRRYIQSQKIVEAIESTWRAERVRRTVPPDQLVKIWAEAEPPTTPLPRGLEALFR